MKFKKKQDSEVMPSIGRLDSVSVALDGGHHFLICLVDFDRLIKMREDAQERMNGSKLLGVPAYCALSWSDDKSQILDVFPAADRDLEIKVRYFPPMLEI